MSRSSGLFWRAAAAFVALPVTVAFVVPWLIRPRDANVSGAAWFLVGLGTALLLWCVRDFYVAGRGTLAPWSPPKHLVTVGLYRWSRNPMYVAVSMILLGWAIAFRSSGVWIYAASVAIAFQLRVVLYEEPWLARAHGDAWLAYRDRVPRWFGLTRAPATTRSARSTPRTPT